MSHTGQAIEQSQSSISVQIMNQALNGIHPINYVCNIIPRRW